MQVDGEWFVDGGTRLNTPVKPALELGADRLVVVALNSVAPADLGGRPDALVGAGGILQALLADQLLQDVRTLETVNELVTDAGVERLAGRRAVPHILVAPERPDTIGRIAREVFEDRYGHLRGILRDADVAVLGRAVDGDEDAAHGELLSYLFFAREFTAELLRLGQEDARRWVAEAHDDGLWRIGG